MFIMSFTLDLKEYADKTEKDIVEIVQLSCIDVFSKVIMDTPVGKPELWKRKPPANYKAGALKANWQASLNTRLTGRLKKKDKSGKRTINRMLAMVKKYDGEGSVWLVNNLPYASRVEYGHSTQAPTGMVRVNLLAFKNAMAAAIKKVKK
jgi:hypothetical protein|tara:strand:- start:340 stop:789 length:450 start_codon:yes stop_codon:yes gene_type:complete